MSYCFVIQPFDQGAFDKRFDDVFAPAIREAGLEPYRVDRDPAVSILIDDIEKGIRGAALCLADISTDNPNVWFELGFALSADKEVVLVCAARHEKFPFDVQHRNILTYLTDAPRDFEDLKSRITKRIRSLLEKIERLGRVAAMSPITSVEGLAQHEVGALVALAQNLQTPDDAVAVWAIRNDMEKAGFTPIATTLALAGLLKKSLVESRELFNQYQESYTAYAITDIGMNWLMVNQSSLVLRAGPSGDEPTEDDIPF